MKIAVAQLDLPGPVERNLEKILSYVSRALDEGAGLLVFPETALTGYVYERFVEVSGDQVEDALSRIQDMVAGSGLCPVVGTPVKEGGRVHNSAVVLLPDGSREVYHKRYLTDYESAWFAPGEDELVFSHGGHKIGVLVCRDQNRPEYAAALAESGARLICIMSAHHYALIESKMKREKNIALPIARAYENNRFVCKANTVGTVQGKISYGNSMIIDPRGIVVARGSESEEQLLSYEADLGRQDLVW